MLREQRPEDEKREPTPQEILQTAKRQASEMSTGSKRIGIPVRTRFIRDVNASSGEVADTPMNRLVAAGSRDGVTLRLYLALLWRCSASPFDTDVPTRRWAELLALPAPVSTYTRRISSALKRLEEENLITVDRTKGRTSVVTLLDESGDGTPYELPRSSRSPLEHWIRVPISLWQDDAFYALGTPGLAMLLAILAERNDPNEPMWWSVSRFEQRIGLTPSTRARGIKQLSEARLLTVQRKKLSNVPGRFARDPSRHTYLLRLDDPQHPPKPQGKPKIRPKPKPKT